MDEILYLEPDEEITSVIDKLRQVSGRKVSLVVPRGATILQSVINLKLLAKESGNLGKEIAIVTADKIGRNLAAQVGLMVYESLKNPRPIYDPNAPAMNKEEVLEINPMPQLAESDRAGLNVHHFQQEDILKPIEKPRVPERPMAKFVPARPYAPIKKIHPHKPFNWKLFFKFVLPGLIIIIILGLVGSYLILPNVAVEIKVIADNFSKTGDFQITGNSENTDPSVFTGTYSETTKDKEEKFATTGEMDLGGKAAGSITIYNKKGSSHSLSAGAKLSSSSKTFVLQSAVTVPGASVSDSGTVVPGTVGANIQAQDPGEASNVKAGTFLIVDLSAADQSLIYGQSTKDITGGFSKQVQVVSQADYDQAKSKLEGELSDTITQEIQKDTPNLIVLDKALKIEQSDLTTSAKVNDQASDFTMKLTERGRVVAYPQAGFEDYIKQQMSAQIPANKMLSLGPDDKISPVVKEINYDQKTLVLTVAVTAKISVKLDTNQIKNDLTGKNQTEANNLLGSLTGIDSYQMTFTPSWWPIKQIPKYGHGVKVNLEYVQSNTETQP